MRNIKIIIEYDGTKYSGWQKQANRKTVQQEIENAINEITGEKSVIHGSGRTDSGVHAYAQVANFKSNSALTAKQFQLALNTVLPEDISITLAEDVGSDFHAQYDSKSKTYIYRILNRDHPSPLLNYRAWLVRSKLDLTEMKLASLKLIGTHDFRAFAHAGLTVKSTERTIYRVSSKKRNDIIEFEIEGNGFLKRMVRLIVGTMVQVGKGRIDHKKFGQILKNGEKNKYVYCAPPGGLYLKEVKYKN